MSCLLGFLKICTTSINLQQECKMFCYLRGILKSISPFLLSSSSFPVSCASLSCIPRNWCVSSKFLLYFCALCYSLCNLHWKHSFCISKISVKHGSFDNNLMALPKMDIHCLSSMHYSFFLLPCCIWIFCCLFMVLKYWWSNLRPCTCKIGALLQSYILYPMSFLDVPAFFTV